MLNQKRTCIFAFLPLIFYCTSSIHYAKTHNAPIRKVEIDTKILMVKVPQVFPARSRKVKVSDKIYSECRFESIPGSFEGFTNNQGFNQYHVKGTEINLDLSPDVFHQKLQISEMQKNPADAQFNLNIVPAELRFALVATICDKYMSGFISNRFAGIRLMYFDRPAKITGNILLQGHVKKFDLAIPEAGFYFVETVAVDAQSSYTNSYYTGSDVFYRVILK